jgi:hypothetical protein
MGGMHEQRRSSPNERVCAHSRAHLKSTMKPERNDSANGGVSELPVVSVEASFHEDTSTKGDVPSPHFA